MSGQGTGDRGQTYELMLPATVRDAMVAHCVSQGSKEACGFLVADASGCVRRIQPMRNVEDSPIGYSMDPKEQLQVEKQLRLSAERVIGIYHSHTASAAKPSPVDVRLAISPDVSYVLVSTMNATQPDVQSYRINGEQVIPEKIKLT